MLRIDIMLTKTDINFLLLKTAEIGQIKTLQIRNFYIIMFIANSMEARILRTSFSICLKNDF